VGEEKEEGEEGAAGTMGARTLGAGAVGAGTVGARQSRGHAARAAHGTRTLGSTLKVEILHTWGGGFEVLVLGRADKKWW